jgi:hypothetical protein
MSSTVHSRVRTCSRQSIEEAAEALGIKAKISDNTIIANGAKFSFDSDGTAKVSYYDDAVQESKAAKQITQLGSFFESKKKLEGLGYKCSKTTKDAVLAVQTRQKLIMEFEEDEALATVNA